MFRFFSAMAVYVVLIFLSTWIFRHQHPGGAIAYTIAVLPAIPLLAVLVVVGLYLIEQTDEFEKTVTIQSMLWGIGGTLALSTVLGFLELYVSIPHLPRYFDFAIFWFVVGIATPIVRLRYR
ncbi:hypothetical protein [Granulicella sibirica]|uniref:Transmembrane protein n=1 Tax=Granulicella sibirica TaxID=2479048 RepID=A0A4Q0T180_9BACT|nr:hypothetical protein [Granulicella sibirica]RXH55166.1 hypothetical protein GRAN_4270 [Granulicella sibirica]